MGNEMCKRWWDVLISPGLKEPEVCSELHPELLVFKLAPSQLSYYCTTVYFAVRTNSLVDRCTAKLLHDTISESSNISGCKSPCCCPHANTACAYLSKVTGL